MCSCCQICHILPYSLKCALQTITTKAVRTIYKWRSIVHFTNHILGIYWSRAVSLNSKIDQINRNSYFVWHIWHIELLVRKSLWTSNNTSKMHSSIRFSSNENAWNDASANMGRNSRYMKNPYYGRLRVDRGIVSWCIWLDFSCPLYLWYPFRKYRVGGFQAINLFSAFIEKIFKQSTRSTSISFGLLGDHILAFRIWWTDRLEIVQQALLWHLLQSLYCDWAALRLTIGLEEPSLLS